MAEDRIQWMSGDVPAMVSAMTAAQRTFAEFARHAELEQNRVVPCFENVSVKAFFPVRQNSGGEQQDTEGEHMFVRNVATDGTTVFGILNSDPGRVRWVKEGQAVRFPVTSVSDWFLVPVAEGTRYGGFTVDVMKQAMSAEELREYEKLPPLMWYKHRDGTTALDELKQLPVCTKCRKRDLIASLYRDGVCGLCINGMERCQCATCNAPLIRPAGSPPRCSRCSGSKSAPKRESQIAENDDEAFELEVEEPRDMTLLAKIYTGLVMAVLAMVLLILGFMIFDPAGGQAAGRPMMLGIGSGLVVVLAGTLVWNIRQRKLAVVSTLLQAVALFLTCIGVPVAVFGIVTMLADRNRND